MTTPHEAVEDAMTKLTAFPNTKTPLGYVQATAAIEALRDRADTREIQLILEEFVSAPPSKRYHLADYRDRLLTAILGPQLKGDE